MRYQGRITDWKDDKGYGFVSPNGGGPRVFVHVASFANRSRRPIQSDLVTYELEADERGRPKGINIAFVGEKPRVRLDAPPGPGGLSLAFGFAAFALIGAAALMGKLAAIIPLAYAAISVVTYLAYALDKYAAVQARRRVSENALHAFSLLGGWPGALLAQKTLRHKTQKQSFQVAFWITVVLNCAAVGWVVNHPESVPAFLTTGSR